MRARSGLMLIAAISLGLDTGSVLAQSDAPSTEGVVIDGDYGYGLPPDISVHGYQMDRLIHVLHWFMGALFVGWGIYFVFCLVRYRQRPGRKAQYEDIKAKPTKYVEVFVVAFEAFLLLVLSIPAWGSLKNDLPTEEENPVRVHVVAEQFMWRFHYPGPDGVFGKRAPIHIDSATNPLGIDPADPAGMDDLTTAALHIPVGEPVICQVSSKDVIHSFSIPVMRIKQDTIPGMRIPVWFRTKPDTEGTYEIACAQLCGNNHYNMKALLVVESREAYDAWLTATWEDQNKEFDEDEFED